MRSTKIAHFFTLWLLLQQTGIVLGQQKTITGQLKDSSGEPLPGVNIVIKGTTIGTITDIDGNYSLEAPIGATLVVSFIGLKTKEILVTEDGIKNNFKDQTGNWFTYPVSNRSLYDSTFIDPPGTYTFSNQSPSYSPKSYVNGRKIKRITKYGNKYRIKQITSEYYYRPTIQVQYVTTLGISEINLLPGMQNTYVQGRPLNNEFVWRGPDLNEVFSWGPHIRTLRHDGLSYDYDKNGRLISANNSLQTASPYNNLNIFRNGHVVRNEITVTAPFVLNGKVHTDLEVSREAGTIPGFRNDSDRLSIQTSDLQVGKSFYIDTHHQYSHSRSPMAAIGSNQSRIISAIFLTPVSFDNSNGLGQTARTDNSSYELSDGSNRSYAPSELDNPFGLVANRIDEISTSNWLNGINLSYETETNNNAYWRFASSNSIKASSQTMAAAITPNYQNDQRTQFLDRDLSETGIHTSQRINYNYASGHVNLNLGAKHLFNKAKVELLRDQSIMDGQPIRDVESLFRNTHEVIVNTKFSYKWVSLRAGNSTYFSNTLNRSNYIWLPAGSVKIALGRLIDLWGLHRLDFNINASKTIREASLIYNNWSYQTTASPMEQFGSFFPSTELGYHAGLGPEEINQVEAGISASVFYINFEAEAYSRTTNHAIYPFHNEGNFTIDNVADIRENGINMTLSYNSYSHKWRWGSKLIWSAYENTVKRIRQNTNQIPLAGFEEVQSVLLAGSPVGTILGSTFQKDQNGQTIIDQSGFPIKNETLQVIGDPNPEWTAGLNGYCSFKWFKVSMLWEFQHGAQKWNGTSAYLDYFGRSEKTEIERNLSNYLFHGVTENGAINTNTASFLDASNSVLENRWTRYGLGGVAEDYIESTNSARLKQLELSYSGRVDKLGVKLSLVAKNLVLITKYSGVDPASALFGNPQGIGLDLFNRPLNRQYLLQLTLKI